MSSALLPVVGRSRRSCLFLLSPANCRGARARQILSAHAQFELAEQLRSRDGAPLGALFSFVSGLYFRGKLAYARRFAAPPTGALPIVGSGVHVITPTAGLQSPDRLVTRDAFEAFAISAIDPNNRTYRRPLEEHARAMADEIGSDCDVVLLGSIASPKYADVLLGIFGDRLRFPRDFVGRGDMSRGGLLLRKVAEDRELAYVSLAGAVRHGPRPPRLEPMRPQSPSK